MTAREVRPPDLEMQVRLASEQGKTRLVYTLHSPTGAVAFAHRVIAGPTFAGSPEQFQRHLVSKVERLGERLDVDGSLLLPDELERKLVNLGRELWRELFPLELGHAYRQIRRAVRSWMIVSDEPWIPWELIKPYDDSQPDDVLDDDFLALRFELTRWLAGDKTPARQITVRRFAVPVTAADLAQAREERATLMEIARSRRGVEDATPASLSAAGILAFLEASDIDLLHFIGHGTHACEHPDEAGIPFPDGSVLRPGDLAGPLATRMARAQPLVFLNACWAGQQGWTLTRLGGWAARWVQVCGCGAFVAPLWPARDKAALAFARAFYEALAQDFTLGAAVLHARQQLAQQRRGDPSALAYTVYGHPNARVRFGDEAFAAETAPEQVDRDSGAVARTLSAPPRRQRAVLLWLRRQWWSPRARRRWAAAALWSGLAVLLATGDRWLAVASWLEARNQEPGRGGTLGARPVGPPPAETRHQNRREGRSATSPGSSGHAEPSNAAPSEPTTKSSAHGIQFEIAAASGAPRSTLKRALEDAAAPLAELGVTGWTLHLDVESPRITPHSQDGLPWETCRLAARCQARRQGSSLDLGTVPVVNSQADGATACEAAAGDLAKSVISRLVTSLRKGTT